QLCKVDDGDMERGRVLLNDLDDLFGALGNFSIDLAAAGIVVPKTEAVGALRVVKRHQVEVTHVGVYVRDTYDFNGPQYLGHWGKEGVEVFYGYWIREKIGGAVD